MNPKKNALRIIYFDQPERLMIGPPIHSVSYLGCNHEGYHGGGHHLPVGSCWMDIWGTTWRREHPGVMGFPVGNPLSNLVEGLHDFRPPDPDDERLYSLIYQQAEGWDLKATFLTGFHRDTLWEKSYMLVGMENMLCYFFSEPEAVRELLHQIMDFQLGIARHYLKIGVEMVHLGDDLGTQSRLLLSPRIIHEFLVPEYRRLFDFYREHGVLIDFHSCGHITPLLEIFLDLGVNILNPIQATANNLDEMRRITQGRMALRGGVRSATLVSGPVEAIRYEAIERMWQLGRLGGYFCCPDQSLPWPEEHYRALEETVEERGRYPLEEPNHQTSSLISED
jgi:uroporphyrinogen decarboxylase